MTDEHDDDNGILKMRVKLILLLGKDKRIKNKEFKFEGENAIINIELQNGAKHNLLFDKSEIMADDFTKRLDQIFDAPIDDEPINWRLGLLDE